MGEIHVIGFLAIIGLLFVNVFAKSLWIPAVVMALCLAIVFESEATEWMKAGAWLLFAYSGLQYIPEE